MMQHFFFFTESKEFLEGLMAELIKRNPAEPSNTKPGPVEINSMAHKGSKKVSFVVFELLYNVSKNMGKIGQTIYCAGLYLIRLQEGDPCGY
jgi:hypothetical protein